MLSDVADVIKRAGTFLDDPSNSIYTEAYILPWVDQCYDELDVDLERCGMQYIESNVTFVNPAGTSDLTPLLEDGQPLATMKFPKRVKWKLPGQPDDLYQLSNHVEELDDVDVNATSGAFQWTFIDGALQVTPAGIDVTLKVYFDQMSTNIIDPGTGVIRGTAHILACMVAAEIAGARKGMEKRAMALDAKKKKLWNAFKTLLVKNNQDKQVTPPPVHGRRRTQQPYASASQAI